MEVEWLILADAAQVVGAKLYLLHVIHSPYQIRRDIVDEYVSKDKTGGLTQEVLECPDVVVQLGSCTRRSPVLRSS